MRWKTSHIFSATRNFALRERGLLWISSSEGGNGFEVNILSSGGVSWFLSANSLNTFLTSLINSLTLCVFILTSLLYLVSHYLRTIFLKLPLQISMIKLNLSGSFRCFSDFWTWTWASWCPLIVLAAGHHPIIIHENNCQICLTWLDLSPFIHLNSSNCLRFFSLWSRYRSSFEACWCPNHFFEKVFFSSQYYWVL